MTLRTQINTELNSNSEVELLFTGLDREQIDREQIKSELLAGINFLSILFTIVNNNEDPIIARSYLLDKARLLIGGKSASDLLDPEKQTRLNLGIGELTKKVVPYADRFHIYKANLRLNLGEYLLRYEDETRPGDFKFSDILFGSLTDCRAKLKSILEEYQREGIKQY